MKKILFLVLLITFSNYIEAQTSIDSVSNKNTAIQKIENYILKSELDSSYHNLSLLKNTFKEPYLDNLERISTKKASYYDYYAFISKVGNRTNLDYTELSDYINNTIHEPSKKGSINLDYVKLKWLQISKLRDNVTLEKAGKEQLKLENYIDNFNADNNDVKKAKILSSTHQIVLYTIQKDLENGKKLCLENLKKAKELNDKKLTIISLYHLCDFLIYEGKLDEYINTCEESLAIENTLPSKSTYYVGTIIHTLDAYIYKGGHDTRVKELLTELYNTKDAQQHSYSLYAKYLGDLNLNASIAKDIFKQFEVSSLVEFCNKTEQLGAKTLNQNDLYQLQREISIALQKQGFLNEAIKFKDNSVVLIQNIYSKDLANSLASFKTKQAVKNKDLEIKYQEEKSNLYFVIASLIAVLLLISVFVLVRKGKQAKLLNNKNLIIEKSLKEKQLLLKEVHHRVKNNFQIVSSLLELQVKGIEDSKAKELAEEGKSRVKSMALIHQKLYQNDDLLIEFDEYIKSLVKDISAMYGNDKNPEINLDVPDYKFDIDTAIPLGLIINELITNAYKYGFETDAQILDISMKKEDDTSYLLEIKDNGKGLPENFDFAKAKSLGLRLVRRLSKQLHGNTNYSYDNGSKFSVRFKDSKVRLSTE